MGKITGFLDYEREDRDYEPVADRVRHWREFVLPLPETDYVTQAARCMNCGVPYCQGTGSVAPGTPGCPVNNQIPDWNDLVYHGDWEEAARNWRSLAEEQASRGDWRDAVHCLYWASIAVLEGRNLWAANRSRTPREYVRLLEAGSSRWMLLRQQTQGFEHVWYGLNEAAHQDYERALELHEGLRAS